MQLQQSPTDGGRKPFQSPPGPSIATLLAAKPSNDPYPGWVLGSGQLENVASRLRRLWWKALRRPFKSAWLENSVVTLYPGNEICRSVFVTGRYEPNEFALLSQVLRPGMTFVDAGANMGLFTLFAARKVGPSGRVLAIEPSQREMELLVSNVRANALTNVTTIAAALSDQDTEQDLLLAPPGKSGHNTLGAFAYNTRLDSRQLVSLRRLDDLLEAEKVSKIDIIKMDIEGSEYAALRGATETLKNCHPIILLELFDQALENQGSSTTQTVALLEHYGYRLYGFDLNTGKPSPFQISSGSQNVAALYGESPLL